MTRWAKIVDFFAGIIMEHDDDGSWTISLGRLAFWACFVPAVLIWAQNVIQPDITKLKDVTPNHLSLLMILLAYNLGKKLPGMIQSIRGGSGQTIQPITINPNPAPSEVEGSFSGVVVGGNNAVPR